MLLHNLKPGFVRKAITAITLPPLPHPNDMGSPATGLGPFPVRKDDFSG